MQDVLIELLNPFTLLILLALIIILTGIASDFIRWFIKSWMQHNERMIELKIELLEKRADTNRIDSADVKQEQELSIGGTSPVSAYTDEEYDPSWGYRKR